MHFKTKVIMKASCLMFMYNKSRTHVNTFSVYFLNNA